VKTYYLLLTMVSLTLAGCRKHEKPPEPWGEINALYVVQGVTKGTNNTALITIQTGSVNVVTTFTPEIDLSVPNSDADKINPGDVVAVKMTFIGGPK